MGVGALLAAALLSLPAPLQTVERRDPRLAEHLLALSAERLDLFWTLHRDATPEARAAAEAALAAGRGPALAWPNRAALARASRAARGLGAPRDEAQRRLAEFADGLDLLIYPGAFDADQAKIRASEGAPLSIAVRVWNPDSLVPPAGPLEIALQLVDFRGEVREVRRTAVAAQAFLGAGFDLYLRAPEGPPGRWWLVPEIHAGERFELGAAVPLDGLASGASEGALLDDEGDCAARRASAQWRECLSLGLRTVEGLDGGALLARLGAGSKAQPRFTAQFEIDGALGDPARSAGRRADTLDCTPAAWRYVPKSEVRAVLVLLAPSAESPAALTRGARGDAWIALADSRGLELWSLAADGDRFAARLESLAAWCLERGLELVPVARANTAFSLHQALAQSGPAGALTSAVARAALRMPGLPQVLPLGTYPQPRALVVAPGVEEDLAGLARGFATLPAHPVVVLDDLLWPERLERWLR